ncbi:hypothetical protein EAG_12239, partial [Camponotus floridanus]
MKRILQCNVNRSRQALDLLMQYVIEEDIAICIISEMPYLRNPNSQFALDESGIVAVYYRPEICNALMISKSKSDGIVMVNIGNLSIISCYLSPNSDRTQTLEYLDSLSDILDVAQNPAIVAGDLNSKSPLWGS